MKKKKKDPEAGLKCRGCSAEEWRKRFPWTPEYARLLTQPSKPRAEAGLDSKYLRFDIGRN